MVALARATHLADKRTPQNGQALAIGNSGRAQDEQDFMATLSG
jgi:hypothetical protein